MADLTPKQKAFCQFYAGNGNATESARLAGYSEKTAQQIGAENLLKPVITEYIASLAAISENKRIATATERQEFWTSVMRGDIEVNDKQLKAADSLGKAQGDFITKLEVSGEIKLETLSDDELDEKIASLLVKANVKV